MRLCDSRKSYDTNSSKTVMVAPRTKQRETQTAEQEPQDETHCSSPLRGAALSAKIAKCVQFSSFISLSSSLSLYLSFSLSHTHSLSHSHTNAPCSSSSS